MEINLAGSEKRKMPAIFIGHGSPINAIENNIYTENWTEVTHQFHKKII